MRNEVPFGYNEGDELPASRLLYRHLVRHLMNRNVARIRAGQW